MLRSQLPLSLITIALLAPMASARATVPQQTGVGSGGRTTTVRSRCATCGNNTVRDSILRQRLERLSLRSDSLRWQIDNVRLSPAERERVATELNSTVLMIKATLDALINAPDVMAGQTPAAVRSGGEGGAAIARTAPGVVAGAGARFPGGFTMVYQSWKPQGYLGVTFDAPSDEIYRDGQQFIRFYQYPKIALVDPSSPAERAGVLVGDTLLALNGTDVRKEISLTRLLVPDSRITVRVRRDGDDKDLNVLVLEAPEYYARRAVPLPRTPRPSEQPERVEVYAPGAPRTSPTPASAPRIWIITEGVAGARLQTISEGLGKALGVREGVLVLAVTPGPAYMAGVREGDVILKVDGQTVPSVRALQEILQNADGEDGVRLVILREKKQQTLTMHWR
jgi:hypothetical protein